MATWRLNNSTLLGGEVCAQWQPNHAYSLGARCVCRSSYGTTTRRAYVYECTTAGTSHATTEPTWPTSGTVSDGSVVWTTRSPNDGTWDNASCHFNYLVNYASAAGDTIYVHSSHNETYSITANLTLTFQGSSAALLKVLCVDKDNGDALDNGALVSYSSSGDYHLAMMGFMYCYGVSFAFSTGSAYAFCLGGVYSATITQNTVLIFESDGTAYLKADTGVYFAVMGYIASYFVSVTLKNFIVNIQSANRLILMRGTGNLKWLGGSLVAPNGCTALLAASSGATGVCSALIRDVDLSQLGNANPNALLSAGSNILYDMCIERCKLPSANHSLTTGTITGPNGTIKSHGCSSSDATYHFTEKSYAGTVSQETTIVRTGGASDGTNPISMKMVSSSVTVESILALESLPLFGWTSSASSQTVTVELVHDSATALQNDEIWMEVECPADNTSGLGAKTTTQCLSLGTPADIPDSTETWTTTGLSNPNTRKITATIDPGKVGPITVRVCLAKASTTVYVDPKITIS